MSVSGDVQLQPANQPATNQPATNQVASTAAATADTLQVGSIEDLLEQSIRAVIVKQITNETVRHIIAIISAILVTLIILLIVLLYISSKSQRIVPASVRNSWLWKKLAVTPLILLVIACLVLIPFMYLSKFTEKAPNFFLLSIGWLLCVFALLKIKTCQRYFILAAGIMFILLATIRLGLFGYDTVTSTGIINTLSRWTQIVAVVFILFDHFMYAPTCRQQSAMGDCESASGVEEMNIG